MRVHCGASGPLFLFEVEGWSTRSSWSPSPCEAAVPPGFLHQRNPRSPRPRQPLPSRDWRGPSASPCPSQCKNRVGGTSLREDGGFLSVILGGSPAGLRKVHPEIE